MAEPSLNCKAVSRWGGSEGLPHYAFNHLITKPISETIFLSNKWESCSRSSVNQIVESMALQQFVCLIIWSEKTGLLVQRIICLSAIVMWIFYPPHNQLISVVVISCSPPMQILLFLLVRLCIFCFLFYFNRLVLLLLLTDQTLKGGEVKCETWRQKRHGGDKATLPFSYHFRSCIFFLAIKGKWT